MNLCFNGYNPFAGFDHLKIIIQSRLRMNPFQNKITLLPRSGTCLLLSDTLVGAAHVISVLLILLGLNRHVHINTGSHGMADGSTAFWKSFATLQYLKPESEEIQKLINKRDEFQKQIVELNKKIKVAKTKDDKSDLE